MSRPDHDAKAEPLAPLLAAIRACRVCRDHPTYLPGLPQEPKPLVQAAITSRICVASQAPGIRAHDSGKPFNDPSGVRLRQWLGVSDAEFYDPALFAIIPMGFCFPGYGKSGSDLPPRRECAPLWHARLFASLPALRLILVIGSHAQRWHLGAEVARAGMNATMQRWRDYYDAPAAVRILPLPHPSWRNSGWLNRNPWFEAELLPVLRAEVRALIAWQPESGAQSPV